MTISTVGIVPGILRLARERQPYNLAVSLHAVDDAERAELIPSARRWSVKELLDACRIYSQTVGRRIFFEWTLIDATNDSPAHAHRLADAIAGIDAHVNLIPLNSTTGFARSASHLQSVNEFQRILRLRGLPATIRQRRGVDVAAGCGQLRAKQSDSDPRDARVDSSVEQRASHCLRVRASCRE
jgi:23S rRNA (adenine2503-C2)-methyltransferase